MTAMIIGQVDEIIMMAEDCFIMAFPLSKEKDEEKKVRIRQNKCEFRST